VKEQPQPLRRSTQTRQTREAWKHTALTADHRAIVLNGVSVLPANMRCLRIDSPPGSERILLGHVRCGLRYPTQHAIVEEV
jgi:hypothetical protein